MKKRFSGPQIVAKLRQADAVAVEQMPPLFAMNWGYLIISLMLLKLSKSLS